MVLNRVKTVFGYPGYQALCAHIFEGPYTISDRVQSKTLSTVVLKQIVIAVEQYRGQDPES